MPEIPFSFEAIQGTLASLAGSALIGILAGIFTPAGDSIAIIFIVTLAGLLGALFDSLLGATVQAIYYCPICEKETEHHPAHLCGTETRYLRGWKWLTNDWVNFACAGFGVLIALIT